MAVTREDVLKIAELAKLHIGDEELESFTAQFQRILDYVEKLKEANVEGIRPTSHVALGADFEKHIFRKDVVRDSLDEADVFSGAPDADAGQFRVPKVI